MPKPLLNPKKCMQATPVITINTNETLPSSWLKDLCQALSLLATETDQTNKARISHVLLGNTSYSQIKDMRRDLKVIAIHWSSLKDTKKKVIANKIYEEAHSCPEGLHIRLKEIIISFNPPPQSVDELLMTIRTDLVLKAARNHFRDNKDSKHQSNELEIHAVNRFYTVASQISLGVNPRHRHDNYPGRFDDDAIAERLTDTFDQAFHVPGILAELITYMSGVLYEMSSYNGMRKDGYSEAELQKALDYINAVLSPMKALGFKDGDGVLMMYQIEIEGEEKWFYKHEQPPEIIKDAEDLGLVMYSDLNWPVIKRVLFEKLIREKYFVIPEDAMACLCTLFSKTPYHEQINLQPLFEAGVISNVNSLYQLLTFSKFVDRGYKINLINLHINKSTSEISKIQRLFDLMDEAKSDSAFIDQIRTFYSGEIDNFINKNVNGNTLRDALIKNNKNTLPFLLRCLSFLNDEGKKHILSELQQDGQYACCNLLGIAAQTSSSAFHKLIKYTGLFTREEKQEYLLKQGHIEPMDFPFRMAVFKKFDDVVKGYLEAMGELSPEEKYSFLIGKANYGNHSIFEMAISFVPKVTPELFKFIGDLSAAQRYDLLKNLTRLTFNLILKPEYTELLLALTIDFSYDQIAAMLLKEIQGYPSLAALLVDYRHFDFIIKMISKCNGNDQLKFISTMSTQFGKNVDFIGHAFNIGPVANLDLFKMIAQFPFESQNILYKKGKRSPKYLACISNWNYGEKINREIWQYELTYRLKLLNELDTKNELSKLLSIIPDNLNTITSWQEIQTQFKEELLHLTPTIQRSNGQKARAFILNVFICLTIIGAVIVLHQLLRDNQRRSPEFGLFKTPRAKAISEIQESIEHLQPTKK